MSYKTKKSATSQRYVYIKRRISKTQGKAKLIGFLYLLATLGVSALACLPLLAVELDGFKLGVAEFWKPFTDLTGDIMVKLIPLIAAAVYALMLLVLAINIVRSVLKLGWLFKRKASKLYGFNRNAYAMDDLGKIFSASFAAIVNAHLVIAVLAGGATFEGFYGYILLGVGLLIHFVCGLFGGNVSLFSTDDGIYEEKREVGNFSPFIRNLLQLVATAATVWLFIGGNTLKADVLDVIVSQGFDALFDDWLALVSPLVQLVLLLVVLAMVGYATGTKEFDMDGAETPGRKRFLLLSLLALLLTGGLYAVVKFEVIAATLTEEGLNNFLFAAIVALVMLIAELCLINCPKAETQELDDVETGAYLSEKYTKPGVYTYSDGENKNARMK